MNQNEKRILGCYFRYIRKSRNQTLSGLSASLRGISDAAISEFENGKSNTSEEVIKYLFTELNIQFDFDENYEIQRKKILSDLVEYYCRNDMKSFEALVFDLYSKPEFKSSLAYPLYLVCEYCYKTLMCEEVDRKQVKKLTDEINASLQVFDEEEKLLYAIIVYRNTYPENETEAYLYLHSILQEYQKSDSVLLSVIKYLLSFDEDTKKDYQKEIELLEAALTVFMEQGFIERMMFCLVNLVVAYNNSFNYEKALFAGQRALRIAEQLNDEKMKMSIINNLAIVHDDMGDYEKAIALVKSIISNYKNKSSLYSILVSSYIELNDISQAKEALKKLEEINREKENPYYYHFIKMHKAIIYDKKGSHYYSALKAFLKYGKAHLTTGRCIRIYEELIKYCRENNLQDDLNQYQDELLECYKNLKI